MSLQTLQAAWQDFFFAPQRPSPMAVYRIIYGLTVLAWCLMLLPDLTMLLGARGMFPLEAWRQFRANPEFNLIGIWPGSDTWLYGLLGLEIVAAACLTVGWCTRPAACVTWLGLLSLSNRCPLMLNSGDTLLRIAGCFVMLSDSGAMYSIDAWRGGRPPESGPPWAQRMLQIQVSLAYLSTFYCKTTGFEWVAGTAVYYTSRVWETWRFPIPYVFSHMWSIRLITWGTLWVEFSLAVLVWIREFRYPILLAGVLLHLGLEYSMNLPLMEWMFIGVYVVFVDATDVESAVDRLFRRPRK